MKRYEKMSKEEIIDVMGNSFDDCRTCPLLDGEGGCSKSWASCGMSLREYLSEEIKTKKVHRYETIKCPEDLDRLRGGFISICENISCTDCIYSGYQGIGAVGCFTVYLNEEIEVEVE